MFVKVTERNEVIFEMQSEVTECKERSKESKVKKEVIFEMQDKTQMSRM